MRCEMGPKWGRLSAATAFGEFRVGRWMHYAILDHGTGISVTDVERNELAEEISQRLNSNSTNRCST